MDEQKSDTWLDRLKNSTRNYFLAICFGATLGGGSGQLIQTISATPEKEAQLTNRLVMDELRSLRIQVREMSAAIEFLHESIEDLKAVKRR
jgi:hypothetical protein